MRQLTRPGTSIPDSDVFADNSGGSFGRVLVPVDSFGAATNALSLATRIVRATGGPLRLVHVRMWDSPTPRGGGRFYPETSEQATSILYNTMNYVWSRGVDATGIVVEAHRQDPFTKSASVGNGRCRRLSDHSSFERTRFSRSPGGSVI